MAETYSYSFPSDALAARSVREACLGTLDPREWRREVLRLGAGLFPIIKPESAILLFSRGSTTVSTSFACLENDIFVHSSLQNSSSSVRLDGDL